MHGYKSAIVKNKRQTEWILTEENREKNHPRPLYFTPCTKYILCWHKKRDFFVDLKTKTWNCWNTCSYNVLKYRFECVPKKSDVHFLFLPDNGECDNRRRWRRRAQTVSPGLCRIIDPKMVNGNNLLWHYDTVYWSSICFFRRKMQFRDSFPMFFFIFRNQFRFSHPSRLAISNYIEMSFDFEYVPLLQTYQYGRWTKCYLKTLSDSNAKGFTVSSCRTRRNTLSSRFVRFF